MIFTQLLFLHTSTHFLVLLPLSSIPVGYHTNVALVKDGGEYSSCRNSHRSTHPQSTHKTADIKQKIKRDKKSQPSGLRILHHPVVIATINNTGHSLDSCSSVWLWIQFSTVLVFKQFAQIRWHSLAFLSCSSLFYIPTLPLNFLYFCSPSNYWSLF